MAVSAYRVTVGTTKTRLDQAGGEVLTIRCPSAAIYLTGPSDAVGVGFELPAGTVFSTVLGAGDSLHAYVASATAEVHCLRGTR